MSHPSAPPAYDTAVNDEKRYDSQYAQSGYQSAPGNPPYPQYPAYPQNYGQPGAIPPPASENAQPLYQPAPTNNTEGGGFTTGGGFDDQSVRRVFIRKVFAILSVQLLVTFGFVCMFLFVESIHVFVRRNPGVYYAAYAVFLIFYLILVCSTSAARNYPCNIIMLICLTLALSYMVGTITTFYSVQAVLIAVGVTAVVCITVMLFSIQTKFDFTKCSGLLFVLTMVFFIFGIITIFTYYRSWYVQVVYGCLGALLFTLFLAFDTQLVMGGRKYELSPEEYIFGALSLYIDIVYIFIFLLSIFGGSR